MLNHKKEIKECCSKPEMVWTTLTILVYEKYMLADLRHTWYSHKISYKSMIVYEGQ